MAKSSKKPRTIQPKLPSKKDIEVMQNMVSGPKPSMPGIGPGGTEATNKSPMNPLHKKKKKK